MAVTRYTCIVKEPRFFLLLLLLDERFQISSLLLTICFKNAPASATDFFLFFVNKTYAGCIFAKWSHQQH